MSSGALPQLNISDFQPQIVWLLVVFTVFYYFIKSNITPYFSNEIESREQYVSKNHQDAKQLQKKAERLADDYQDKIQAIHAKANHLISEAKQALSTKLELEKEKINNQITLKFDEHCKLIEQQLKQIDKDFLSHIDMLKNNAETKIFINYTKAMGVS
jgi:F-type H+-transporting ATPase subunit b